MAGIVQQIRVHDRSHAGNDTNAPAADTARSSRRFRTPAAVESCATSTVVWRTMASMSSRVFMVPELKRRSPHQAR
jgi:hypothetical protein